MPNAIGGCDEFWGVLYALKLTWCSPNRPAWIPHWRRANHRIGGGVNHLAWQQYFRGGRIDASRRNSL